MASDARDRITDLYHAALKRPPADRVAFLKEACAGDEALRQEVESLLGYESASARFLEQPAPVIAESVVPEAATGTPMVNRQLGPYTIMAPLGAGGMGEVYRARDSKLGRDVAIKILPAHLTADPERRARFAREARVLATLNHPHIGAIYGLEDADGLTALVLELVDGPTLAERLARGPLPMTDALTIARQIAEALDAAHEKGIVHRDLKPANIVLQEASNASGVPSGGICAKVLDFGLAKTMAVRLEDDLIQRQSGSLGCTEEGRILGTPAYMSPEQARGQAVDKRTDIWAFGCVLYEMLAGRAAFGGDTVSDTFVAILDREPDWDALPVNTPAIIRTLLHRCLRKDLQNRLHDIADARIEIDDRESRSTSFTSGLASVLRGRFSVGMVGAVLLALIVGAAWRWFGPAGGGRPPPRGDVPSVAVLPFGTIGDSEQYFADGISEALTTELGQVAGLRVIASNSTFAYRGTTKSLREIGGELGVGLIVQGTVRRAGMSVRLNVSLVDTRDDTALWSERYSREITDVLAVQDDIASQIAGNISKRFGTTVTAKSQSVPTTSSDAYDAYLRGLWHLKERSSVATSGTRLVAAIGELERAVDTDRDFALARAALATAYTQRFFYDATDPILEQKASVQIDRALAINPNQAEAYLARAQLTWNLRNGFPHEQAVTDLRRALSINANLADAYGELAKIYYHVGLTDKAVDASDQALRLDPSAGVVAGRRLRSFTDAGRLQNVRNELERNGTRYGPYTRGDGLVAMGRLQEALQVLSQPQATESGNPESDIGAIALLGVVHARLGHRLDAERIIAAAIPRAQNPMGLSHVHHAQFHIGSTFALLGRYDDAVRWLTKAVEQGYPSYARFSTDQTLVRLNNHAGFVALMNRLRQDRDRWLKTL